MVINKGKCCSTVGLVSLECFVRKEKKLSTVQNIGYL
jgi:hypothetical protein